MPRLTASKPSGRDYEPPKGAETTARWTGGEKPLDYTATAKFSSCARRRSRPPRCSPSRTSRPARTRRVRSHSSSTAAQARRRRTSTWAPSDRSGSFPATERCRPSAEARRERVSWLAFADLVFVDPVGPASAASSSGREGREARQGRATGRRREVRPERVLRPEARPRVALRVHGALAFGERPVELARFHRRRELRRLPRRPTRADAPGGAPGSD